MASSLEYVQYVAAQLSGAGVISYKKLFGEYGLWCGGKFFGTVENNQFYVKMTSSGSRTGGASWRPSGNVSGGGAG